MSIGLRRSLRGIPLSNLSNPGLAFQRYVPEIVSSESATSKGRARRFQRYVPEIVSGKETELGKMFGAIAAAQATEVYKAAFERWKGDVGSLGARCSEVRYAGRVVVGLGNGSVLETSIALHPVYGMPVIPGSALKGLARHYFGDADAQHGDVLFGDRGDRGAGSKSAGYVTYFDAWWIPDPNQKPFRRDVLTTHHSLYYTGGAQRRAPTDFDDPTPIPFLSATGRFLLAVAGPSDKWSDFAMALLRAALSDWGVGAKTSSGYGRIVREGSAANAEQSRPAGLDDALRKRIGDLTPQSLSTIPNIITAADERKAKREAAQLIKARLVALKRWTPETVDKQWRKAVEDALADDS